MEYIGFSFSHITTGNNRFAEYQNICRVHSIEHSAKKLFAECCRNHTRQNNGTRYIKLFAECGKKTNRQTRKKHLAKQRHMVKNRHVDIRQLVCLSLGVCRVSVSGTRQKNKFAECLCCDTRQRSQHLYVLGYSLSSVQYLTLSKDGRFTECPGFDTRQRRHVCRVLGPGHSANAP